MPSALHWGFFFVLYSLSYPLLISGGTFLPCLVSALVSFYFYFFLNELVLFIFFFSDFLWLSCYCLISPDPPSPPLHWFFLTVISQDHPKPAQKPSISSIASIKVVLPLQFFFKFYYYFFCKIFSQIVWKHMFSSFGLYFKYFLPLQLTLLTSSEKALIFV